MTLQKKVTRGMIWVTISAFSIQTIGIIGSIILARLLQPEDFGLLALSTVVISLSNIISQVGFSEALIQRKKIDQNTIDTAFTVNLFLSLFFTGSVLFTSTLIANLFNEPQMSSVLKVLAFNIVIISASVIPSNLLERELAFKRKLLAEIIPPIGYAIVTISGALTGWGVWSLVVGLVFSSLLRTILMWRIARYCPSWQFDWRIAKELWKYGQYLVYSSLLLFFASNLDTIYIGRFISVTQVGFYGLAFGLANLSTEYIAKQFGRVLFPAFSRIQNNLPRLREAYLTSVRYIAYATFPMAFGLAAIAPTIVLVLYTTKWSPAIPLIQILSFYGLFRTLGRTPLLAAIGKPAMDTKVLVLRMIVLALAIFPLGNQWGAVGVAGATTLAMLVSVLWKLHQDRKFLEISIWTLFDQIGAQLIASLVMAIGVGYLAQAFNESFLSLGVIISVGVVIYFLVLFLLAGKRLWQDGVEITSLLFQRGADRPKSSQIPA